MPRAAARGAPRSSPRSGGHAELEFVNGGGTGSVAATAADPAVTEVAAGSGLFGPTAVRRLPRAGARDRRRSSRCPWSAGRTRGSPPCSAAAGSPPGRPAPSRLPLPWLPGGLKLIGTEGAGEVQTPLVGPAAAACALGDRVWFRHAKAGELCEHVNEVHLVAGDHDRGRGADLPGRGQSVPVSVRWRAAMERALYGDGGFFRRPDTGPAAHFRTSAHASPLFAGAIAALLERSTRPWTGPPGSTWSTSAPAAASCCAASSPPCRRPWPPGSPPSASRSHPARMTCPTDDRVDPGDPVRHPGLLVATEWLDNIPRRHRGARFAFAAAVRPGAPPTAPRRSTRHRWSRPTPPGWPRWWPLDGLPEGARAELGAPRDEAWAAAVGSVTRGLALAVDYGHLAGARPLFGTLTGFRDGKETPPVPDGSCDLTVAVALDSLGVHHLLMTQREALRLLGVHGGRPPIALASTDPAGYVRALARAGEAAELTDPAGLGGAPLGHAVGMNDSVIPAVHCRA